MKKLIRLTEGDLHRIIENSVHNVLNELDSRTVAGYIQGRDKQSTGGREYSDAMKRRSIRDFVYKGDTGNANGNDSWRSYNSPEDAAY